jgi:hypothetical protein
MATTGTFHITGSFTITGRGLTIVGDITSGNVKVGSFVTFTVDGQAITLQIGGLGMGRSVGRETDYVGLTFAHPNEEERKRFERLKVPEQDVEIRDDRSENE